MTPAAVARPAVTRPTRMAKRSLSIAGHRTSVSLEDAFWAALTGIAARRGTSVAALVAEVDAARDGANLSSALRVFILEALLAPDEPSRASSGA